MVTRVWVRVKIKLFLELQKFDFAIFYNTFLLLKIFFQARPKNVGNAVILKFLEEIDSHCWKVQYKAVTMVILIGGVRYTGNAL